MSLENNLTNIISDLVGTRGNNNTEEIASDKKIKEIELNILRYLVEKDKVISTVIPIIEEAIENMNNSVLKLIDSESDETATIGKIFTNKILELSNKYIEYIKQYHPTISKKINKIINSKETKETIIKANEILARLLQADMRELTPNDNITPDNTIIIHCHGDAETEKLFLLPKDNRLITYQPIGYTGYSTKAKKIILQSKKINPLAFLEDVTHTQHDYFEGYTKPHIWEATEENGRVFNFDYLLSFTYNNENMRPFGFYACNDETREMKLAEELFDKAEHWKQRNKKIIFKKGDILIPVTSGHYHMLGNVRVTEIIGNGINIEVERIGEKSILGKPIKFNPGTDYKNKYLNVTQLGLFPDIPKSKYNGTGEGFLENPNNKEIKANPAYQVFIKKYNPKGIITSFTTEKCLNQNIPLSDIVFFITNYTTFENIGLLLCKPTNNKIKQKIADLYGKPLERTQTQNNINNNNTTVGTYEPNKTLRLFHENKLKDNKDYETITLNKLIRAECARRDLERANVNSSSGENDYNSSSGENDYNSNSSEEGGPIARAGGQSSEEYSFPLPQSGNQQNTTKTLKKKNRRIKWKKQSIRY